MKSSDPVSVCHMSCKRLRLKNVLEVKVKTNVMSSLHVIYRVLSTLVGGGWPQPFLPPLTSSKTLKLTLQQMYFYWYSG